MSPGFAVFILMNNYFHDVATAMPLASAIAMAAVLRSLEKAEDPTVVMYFSKLAGWVRGIAWFSVAWIVVSGIPRALTFTAFEWPNAAEKHHEAGLIAKYIIASVMMVAGAYLWLGIRKRVGAIRRGSVAG